MTITSPNPRVLFFALVKSTVVRSVRQSFSVPLCPIHTVRKQKQGQMIDIADTSHLPLSIQVWILAQRMGLPTLNMSLLYSVNKVQTPLRDVLRGLSHR